MIKFKGHWTWTR